MVPKHFRQLVGNAISELLAVHHISKHNWVGTHRIICRFNSIRECFPLGLCVPEDTWKFALQFGIGNIECHSLTSLGILSCLNSNNVPILLSEVCKGAVLVHNIPAQLLANHKGSLGKALADICFFCF